MLLLLLLFYNVQVVCKKSFSFFQNLLYDTVCLFSLPLFSSGLGYIVGSAVDKRARDWHWALRVSLLAHHVPSANLQFHSDVTFTLVMTCTNASMPVSHSLLGYTCAGTFSCAVVGLCGEGAQAWCYRISTRTHPAQDQLACWHECSLQEVSSVLILQLGHFVHFITL